MPGDTTLGRRPIRPDSHLPPREVPAASPSPQTRREEHSYYDVSMLKPPVWGWEIATYFFLGGVSAGAYLLARVADRFGGRRYRPVVRAGTAVAALAAVPCAPLLIADLGDPKRFHHMLRVWKPQSPMNLGAWTLTAYSGAVATAVLREWLRGDRTGAERDAASRVLGGILISVTDAAGIPLALLLAGYTGVLLSGTSTPLWSENIWLGPMFSASAVNTGTDAIRLVLGLRGGDGLGAAEESLRKIGSFGRVAELIALSGFKAAAGALTQPLTSGKLGLPFWLASAGLLGGALLDHLPVRGRTRRCAGLVSSALGLAAGFGLRWSLVHAGRPSAQDPRAARQVSQPRGSATGLREEPLKPAHPDGRPSLAPWS